SPRHLRLRRVAIEIHEAGFPALLCPPVPARYRPAAGQPIVRLRRVSPLPVQTWCEFRPLPPQVAGSDFASGRDPAPSWTASRRSLANGPGIPAFVSRALGHRLANGWQGVQLPTVWLRIAAIFPRDPSYRRQVAWHRT